MKFKDVQATSHIKALVIFFGVIFTCFVWMGLYFVIQTERQLEIGNTFKETTNYARMFEEHTVRTIKGLDQVAMSIKYEVEKNGFNIDLRRLVNEGRFSGQPFVALGVLDKSGELVASSQEIVSRINNSDLEFFQVHKMADNAKLYVSKPLLGRASGKWLIQMSRRINQPDGTFGGVVVVGVDPYYFAQFYTQVDLGESAGIALVGRDGIVRVHQSGNEVRMGMDVRQRVNNEFSRGVAGNFKEKGITDGINRLFSYRNLEEYPLTVVVGASEDHIFKNMNRRVTAYYWAGTALSGLVILFIALLLVSIRRRERVEFELRESENRFRAYFQENKSVMLLDDKETFSIVDANPAAADFYGYSLAQLKQMKISEINMLPPVEIAEKIEKASRRHENAFLFPHRLASGEIRQVEVYSTPIRIGQKEKLHSIIHDVTERVKLEAKLMESESRKHSYFEQAPYGVFIANNRGEYVEVNPKACELTGYSPEELTQKSIPDLVLAEELDEGKKHFEKAMESGYSYGEYRFRTKDGTVRWWSVAATKLSDVLLLGFCADITERKQAEDKLQQSEQRYRSLMMQAHDAVALFDLETLEITEVNPAFEKMTGYHFPFEKPLHVFDFIVDDPVNIMRYLDETHTNGVLQPTLRKIRICDGSIREVERTGSMITIDGRHYQLTTLRDVTKERLKQREIQTELLLAAQVQRDLLPVVPRSNQFSITTVFKPSGFVSGDFYHLEWNEERSLLQGFLFDLTGHGMATALQTAAFNVLLHELMDLPHKPDLAELLVMLNRRVPHYVDENSFVAAIGFEIDFFKRELRYAAAGISFFLFNAERVTVPGLYLGINEAEAYELHTLPIAAGDSVCFMTDGISDVFDADKSWGQIKADQVCGLYTERDLSEKAKDDATAICITVSGLTD